MIERRVDASDVPLAKSVIKQGVDRRGIDTEPRGCVAVNLDRQCVTGALLIAGDIGNRWKGLQLLQQQRCPVIKLVAVDINQRELILGLGKARPDVDVLRRLHVERYALNRLQRPVQARDHLVGGRVSFTVRLERNEHSAVILSHR